MLDQIQKGWKAEMGKLEELISATKLNDFLKKNEEQEKKKTVILWVFAIVGAVAVSYTHLDVYKRQGSAISGRSSWGRSIK